MAMVRKRVRRGYSIFYRGLSLNAKTKSMQRKLGLRLRKWL